MCKRGSLHVVEEIVVEVAVSHGEERRIEGRCLWSVAKGDENRIRGDSEDPSAVDRSGEKRKQSGRKGRDGVEDGDDERGRVMMQKMARGKDKTRPK
jgi:hypothetical protein